MIATETIPFVEFPKMARLSRDCVITEKIDGMNAQITITADGQFLTGSRTRWITPDDDCDGFARWANVYREELMELGVGSHFGEWWGSGIGRGYGLPKGQKHWSLFNTARWIYDESERTSPKQKVMPRGVLKVPVIYSGPFTTEAVSTALERMKTLGSVAAPGFANPEGIVVFHTAANMCFKKTIKDDDKPKSLV